MTLPGEVLEAIHSQQPVSGLTHGFYRYPARFSPLFARSVIRAYTKQGDLVLDPFMGGGTTLVEATALGRNALGVDVNPVAVFAARVKSTLFFEKDFGEIRQWALALQPKLNLRNPTPSSSKWRSFGYDRNITGRSAWPIRKTIELTLAHVAALKTRQQRDLARCALLKTGQWALDCRRGLPTGQEFRERLIRGLDEMLEGAKEYAGAVMRQARLWGGRPVAVCLHRSAIGLETDENIRRSANPALVLTSPPYPGVHILYHRWQFHGRRETAAPFWITDTLDGNGEAFYGFGSRKEPHLKTYYQTLYRAFLSIARIASQRTIVVQLLSFSDPEWQLRRYLEVMKQAGFEELDVCCFPNTTDGRLWRHVPNRKWYANQRTTSSTSHEVVLFHRLRR